MTEFRPSSILFRAGGRCLDLYGVPSIGGGGRPRTGDPTESMTRGSIGYYLDRAGIIRKAEANVLRDYWPVGVVDSSGRRVHGPLSEAQRVNGWATVTENYNDVAWTKAGCTVSPNVHVAPDGVLASADKIVESALNEEHRPQRAISGATDSTRTSVWWLVKPAERTWCRIGTGDKAGLTRYTWFNLATGAIGTKDSGHDAWIVPLGSSLGYFFVAASFNVGVGGGTPFAGLYLATADGVTNYAGDGASGLYLWESAVEVDRPFPSHPGSILPNGLTRQADVWTAEVPSLTPRVDFSGLVRIPRPLHQDVGAGNSLGINPQAYSLGGGLSHSLVVHSAPPRESCGRTSSRASSIACRMT